MDKYSNISTIVHVTGDFMLDLDKNKLDDILEKFHILTGFRIAVFDDSMHEVSAYPAAVSRFCSLLRDNPSADKICKGCDKTAFAKAAQIRKLHLYQCDFGLYEAVVPLIENNEIIGYMMIGQMMSTKSGAKQMVSIKSNLYWSSSENREFLLDELPLLDYQKIEASAMIMSICASYLSITNNIRKSKPQQIKSFKEYLDQHYKENISIDKLCSQFGIGRTTLFALMKKNFGKTIKQYCNNMRLEEAKNSLTSTDLSIKEIAFLVGFSDQNYFSRLFYQKIKISPKQYRIEHRK